mmetsp:Transcript_36955/g.61268  ORF Transcript_36955/g.61268 Transcript_36955/m.61268 type:complete len:204 (+) Transcript_36955:322-933(+)
MRLLSTEKPRRAGSTTFFLPLRLLRCVPPSASLSGCVTAAALPLRLAVCHSRDSPVPRAARLCRVNSRAKVVTVGEEPRYMLRYDWISSSFCSEKRKCVRVVSSFPVSSLICSSHQRAIAGGIWLPSMSKVSFSGSASALPLLCAFGGASEEPLPFFFFDFEDAWAAEATGTSMVVEYVAPLPTGAAGAAAGAIGRSAVSATL